MDRTVKLEFATFSVAQMQEAERRTETEYGIPLAALMDNAGHGLADAAFGMLPEPGAAVGIFCGSGNNGGDGYVCATYLMNRGAAVTVWGIGHEKLQEGSLAKNAADAFLSAGGKINPVSLELRAENVKCSLIVDALLGTGLGRPVSGLYAHAVDIINSVPVPVMSCDLPSGVDADTGQIMGVAVRADKTLVMGLAKKACLLPPGCGCFGEQSLCDIGLPQQLVDQISSQ
ncbi:MAG: NAD(P)H-hydrate epimerase [Clostridiales bacterium]|nr:NAD(P)H-hydrate epimerase [Clostridiales bacterium]